jgi:hypothetical protein
MASSLSVIFSSVSRFCKGLLLPRASPFVTNWVLGYIFFGFFIFFPVTVPDFITIELVSFISHADILGYVALALLPAYGPVIGGAFGYHIRKRESVKQ